MNEKITVETLVRAPVEHVWSVWTEPQHITQWNFASDDWQCPRAENDLRVGGLFRSRMEARDGSMGFEFEGTYTEVRPGERLVFSLGEDREVTVDFSETPDGTLVRESFTPESTHPVEVQRAGWQSILENFRRHAEATHTS